MKRRKNVKMVLSSIIICTMLLAITSFSMAASFVFQDFSGLTTQVEIDEAMPQWEDGAQSNLAIVDGKLHISGGTLNGTQGWCSINIPPKEGMNNWTGAEYIEFYVKHDNAYNMYFQLGIYDADNIPFVFEDGTVAKVTPAGEAEYDLMVEYSGLALPPNFEGTVRVYLDSYVHPSWYEGEPSDMNLNGIMPLALGFNISEMSGANIYVDNLTVAGDSLTAPQNTTDPTPAPASGENETPGDAGILGFMLLAAASSLAILKRK